MDLIRRFIYSSIIKKGNRYLEEVKEASLNANEYTKNLLLKLVNDSKDTEYGRLYHFDQIKSIEDYKRLVPISNYDDYAPFIERMVNKGEKNLFTSREVVHYAQSSGSVGVPKNIPVVQETIDLYSEVGCSRSFAMANNFLKKNGKKFPYSKGLNLIEITERQTPLGVTKGAISSTALKHVRPFLKYIMTTPDEVIFPTEDMDLKYLKLLFALQEENIVYFVGAFTTSLVDIMVYLTEHWQDLVEDVKNGKVSEKVDLSPELRVRLNSMLKPKPKRAAFLKAEFEKGFEGIVPRIWPDIAWVGGIGTGTFEPYTENLRKYIGDYLPLDNLLYAASESIFACSINMNDKQFLMIPQSGFYEFVPAESDDLSHTLNIDELEVGKDYEIILTNLSGLYRYRIYDVVRVLGYYGQSPMVQFVYRKNQVVNLAGEKTTSEALAHAIEQFSKELGVNITDYSIFPDTSTELARYVFMIEPEKPLDISKLDEYAQIMEEKLGDASPAFKFAVMSGEIAHSGLYIVQPQTYALWRDLMIAKGTSPNQIKPVRVIDTPVKEKFFMGLIER